MHRVVSQADVWCCDLVFPYCLLTRYMLNNSLTQISNTSLCAKMPKLSWL